MPGAASLRGPFKGLPSFERADSPIFFGRDTERRLCLNSLAANRVTVLYAPSGVGKSSLLAAGVLPDIEAEALAIAEDREDPAKRTRPGQAAVILREWNEDPLRALTSRIEAAMRAADVDSIPPAGTGIDGLLAPWTSWMGGPVYLIFDQFERLYGEGRLDAKTIEAFIQCVAALVNGSDIWVNVLIALREDCLSVLDHISDAIPAAKRNWLRLDELGEAGAREAIEGPVRYWRRDHPSDPEVSPAFVEGLLAVTHSTRTLSFKLGAGKHYNTALLQMILKERWETAVRTRAQFVEAPSTADGYKEGVNVWVRARLSAIPGALQTTAARIFSRMISSTGRPVPQSLDELASATGPDGEPLDKEHAAEVVRLLSDTSREEFILQEVPADGILLYTIRQDFLVKPVDSWARDLLSSAAIRNSVWTWFRERKIEFIAGLLAVAVLLSLWQWRETGMDRDFMLTGPSLNNVPRRSDVYAAGATFQLRSKVLAAGDDGALFWVVLQPTDINEDVNGATLDRTHEQRNSLRSPALSIGSGGTPLPVLQTHLTAGGKLLRIRRDIVFGPDEFSRNKLCIDRHCEVVNATGAFAGFITGMRGGFYAGEEGLSLVFIPSEGRPAPPVPIRISVDSHGNKDGAAGIAVSCTNDTGPGSGSELIAYLTRGGRTVRIWRCDGRNYGYFDLPEPASHIALIESQHRHFLDPSIVVRLAVADDSGCIKTYDLKGRNARTYPDPEEKQVLLHWPVVPLSEQAACR